jgi:PAS domain S-box-containing protein
MKEFKARLKELTQCANGIKVLYVEDKEQIRENIRSLLCMIFTSVDVASNGREGLKKYTKYAHELVISDILMPEMNGIEMIRAIKKINPEQNFIITSACEESNFLLELINLGVAQFILKPINSEQMIDVMHQVIMNIYNAKKVEEFTLYLEQEVLHQSTLLEQYKEIVDVTMIVTKTDPQGRITYVNEAFCEVSGYTREELLGKNHNIVRHPDVPSEVFSNMWNTILDKKIWHGTIKNRKKDGSYYITDSTVKPILDEYGNILEFMSIRYDVTMLFDLNEEIWQTQHEMLYLLGEVGETRSRETGNHVRRVAKFSKLLAELHGLNEEETNLLYSASPMHDIGKIGIPDAVLLKPGKLDETEFLTMKKHAEIGFEILKNSKRPLLKAAAIIAHEHHERWDGNGYPQKLSGEDIHIYGRITALADVFDALGCARIYKKSWPMEEVIAYIKRERGKQFDPDLVDLFIGHMDKFIAISEEFRDSL